jgi:hypothetical protein
LQADSLANKFHLPWPCFLCFEANRALACFALLLFAVAYLTNAFVVPLLAAYFAGSSSSWYSRGGLMESAFFMQAAAALLPPLGEQAAWPPGWPACPVGAMACLGS